jgi:hypothetical protein
MAARVETPDVTDVGGLDQGGPALATLDKHPASGIERLAHGIASC